MDFVNMIHVGVLTLIKYNKVATLKEESVRNFKFDFGAIEQIVLMPIEYAIYLKDSDSKNRYDESSTMVLGYLLVVKWKFENFNIHLNYRGSQRVFWFYWIWIVANMYVQKLFFGFSSTSLILN